MKLFNFVMELETFCVLLGDRCVAPAAIDKRWYNASGICKVTVSAIFFIDGLIIFIL
jgi:Na+-transporting NADH:ubiquinone oxidoreductase subunit NqrD